MDMASMKNYKIGILLSVITILYGFALGGLFGGNEEGVKKHLLDKAQKVAKEVYKGDTIKMKEVTKKSWVYLKRAHLHANGLGVISLGAIFLLMGISGKLRFKKFISIMISLGALGYSLYWLLAGLKAPVLGSTGLAKEYFSFLAIPSAGFCILGIFLVLFLVVKMLFERE